VRIVERADIGQRKGLLEGNLEKNDPIGVDRVHLQQLPLRQMQDPQKL
jgi:hypothetical protein